MSAYLFRPATAADIPLCDAWLEEPHVAAVWDDPPVCDVADLGDGRVRRWIVETGGAPLAYLQDYDVHGWEGHPFAHLPKGARGMDTFIGPAAMLERGHGAAYLRQHVAFLLDEGAPALGIDPHPANTRAIAAYRKVGFAEVGAPVETDWGLVQLMEFWP